MLRSTSGLGHHPFKVELSEEGHGFESRTEYKIDGPFVYRSRTPPFHGGEMGSIPIWTTKKLGSYTVEVAGQTVNLLSNDSGGSTPSLPT